LPEAPIVHTSVGGYPCAEPCAGSVAYKFAGALLAGAGRDPAEADPDLERERDRGLSSPRQPASLASRRWAAPAALLLAAWLVACGSAEKDSEGARQAVDAWVKAVNMRDWDRACALDSAPDSYQGKGCSARIEQAFGSSAGRIRVAGSYRTGDSLLYGIKTPTGAGELSTERTGDRWRVHPEVTVIR